MKRLLLATLGIFALASGSALAADMGLPVKAPPLPPPSWTGCYVSAGFGYGMLDDERSTSIPADYPASTSAAKGWLGAFGGGCDYQFNGSPIGPIVIGAFGDWDPMDITGKFGDPENDHHNGTQTERDAWYAGGRAGVLITPNLLSYIDGGGTGAYIGRINIDLASGAPTGVYLPSENATGWFIGGGAEYALTWSWLPISGLFWKTEYRFASYDSYDQHYIHPVTGPGSSIVHNSVDVQTVTSSLVWRFNWTGH